MIKQWRVLGLFCLFAITCIIGIAQEIPEKKIFDSSGTMDLKFNLRMDQKPEKNSGNSPDREARNLLGDSKDLFKRFTEQNQRTERNYFADYPVVEVEIPLETLASSPKALAPSNPGDKTEKPEEKSETSQ